MTSSWTESGLASPAPPTPPAEVAAWAPTELDGQHEFPAYSPGAGTVGADAPNAAELIEARIAAEIEAAYERGYAEGLREGRQDEAARFASAVRAAERAIDELRAAEAGRLEAAESNIAALAMAAARHVIGREVAADGAALIADLARRALTHFPANQPVRVRVHPADLSLISAIAPDRSGPIPIGPGREVRWLADTAIERGGCVVEGHDRVVDGRVDLALERIYWALISE